MSQITNLHPQLQDVTHDELRQMQGGALPLLGIVAVWAAKTAIVYAIDKATGRDNRAW